MPTDRLRPGLHPFWFWNTRMDQDLIAEQLGQLAAQGCRGVFIHPRQGLAQAYLGGEFLALVRFAVREAARLGLTPHLYDEFPYPSGAAGGLVSMGRPELWARRLRHHHREHAGGAVRWRLSAGEVLACMAFPLRNGQVAWDAGRDLLDQVGVSFGRQVFQRTGLTAYNRLRFFGAEPEPVLETSLPEGAWQLAACVQEVVEDQKYVHRPPDALNPDAMARFRALTHERYAAALGEDLALVGSVFTDEIEPGWSPLLLPRYAERHGEPLAPLLIALGHGGHPRHLETALRLQQLRLEGFEASFEAPTAAWCAAHQLRYCGEKPSLRLDQLAWMDVPGCEPGHTKAGAPRLDLLRAGIRANARATASAAYLAGREGALCECYHSLGWGATLQDLRLIADHLLLLGIRYLVPHGVFASAHGLRQHDAPPSVGPQMPWWPHLHRLSARVEAIAAHLDGAWSAEIALVDPTPGLPTPEQSRGYEALQQALLAAHREWVVIDTSALPRAPSPDGVLRLRDLSVRVVVVPPMRVLEPERAARLEAFRQGGGTVVDVADEAAVPAAVALIAARSSPALACAGPGADELLVTRVASSDGPRWLVSNPAREPRALRVPAGIAEVALEDGLCPRLARTADGGERVLAPFEAIALARGQPPAADELPPLVEVDCTRPGQVRPHAPNLLRLDRWRLAYAGSAPAPRLVEPMTIVEQLAEAGLAIAPGFERAFGLPPRMRLPAATARYSATFRVEAATDPILVLEPDGIRGDWSCQLDGVARGGPGDLAPIDAHLPACGGLALGMLAAGEHEIAIDIACAEPDDGLLTAPFLSGAFGVALQPTRLCAARSEGVVGDWVGSGLPHYAGVVEHRLAVPLALTASRHAQVDLRLALPPGLEDALEISCNGHGWRAVPWSPWRVQVPRAELREGLNDIAIRIASTLDRTLTGAAFDAAEHRYRPIDGGAGPGG